MKHLAPNLAPILVAALTLLLTACNDPAQSEGGGGTVKPQPVQSAPIAPQGSEATQDTEGANDAKDTDDANGTEDTQAPAVTNDGEETAPTPAPQTSQEAKPATPELPAEAEAAPQPQPVATDETVPTEAASTAPKPATPAPAVSTVPDADAATRTDPVPDEVLQAEHGISEAALEDLEVQPNEIYFPNCAAANAGGFKAVRRGEPGYSAELDDDGDGIACE